MKSIRYLFVLWNVAFIFTSCSGQILGGSIKGEGEIEERSYEIEDFTGVGLGIPAEVTITKGSSNTIRIQAQPNILDNIKRKVKDGTLGLEFDRNVRKSLPIKVFLEMDQITNLAIGGSGGITVEDRFEDLDRLELAIGGSGSIALSGQGRRAEMSVAGSGNMNCPELKVDRAEVSIAGSGDVTIHVVERLEVSIAGSGDVRYRGTPEVESSIVGSGDVRALNN